MKVFLKSIKGKAFWNLWKKRSWTTKDKLIWKATGYLWYTEGGWGWGLLKCTKRKISKNLLRAKAFWYLSRWRFSTIYQGQGHLESRWRCSWIYQDDKLLGSKKVVSSYPCQGKGLLASTNTKNVKFVLWWNISN